MNNDAAVYIWQQRCQKDKDDFASAILQLFRMRNVGGTITSGMKGPHFGLDGEVAIKTPSHIVSPRGDIAQYNCIFLYKCSRFFDAISPE